MNVLFLFAAWKFYVQYKQHMEVYKDLAENVNNLTNVVTNVLSEKAEILTEGVKKTLENIRNRSWKMGLALKTASDWFPIEEAVVVAQSDGGNQ